MDRENPVNGWDVWKRFVLGEMDRLGDGLEQRSKKLDDQHEDVLQAIHKLDLRLTRLGAEVKIKGGVWGLIGSLIPVSIAIGLMLLREGR